jgi:aminoglycoside phosphotransferase (APT) family kinase protein
MGSATDDLASRFAAWLGTPGVADGLTPVEVTGVTRLSGGASRQSFRVDCDTGAGHRSFVVQRVRPQGITSGIAREADAVRAAADAGVPVPQVIVATDDAQVLGGPAMVVEFLPGETLARLLLRDERFATARLRLPRQAAAALAAVHRMDDPGLRSEDPVATLEMLHRSMGRAQPVFEFALRWLAANRPTPPATPVVVHGDFRLGNLLTDDQGLVAVLDWELAHLGDPVEDLAWACVKAWRFGSELPALGLCGVDTWVDAYAAAGGKRPDTDHLRWWLVYGTLRWGVICELQAAAHLSGAVDSIELAMLGRRVAETEHDLLDLLGLLDRSAAPDASASAEPGGPTGHSAATAQDREPPHDPPSMDVLLGAVERFLDAEVTGATTGQVRFHARVAANAVRVVRRQLAAGAAPGVDHAARLATLGVNDDAGLAAAITRGTFDQRHDELAAVLVPAVVAKLQVAAPAYLLTAPADPWRRER